MKSLYIGSGDPTAQLLEHVRNPFLLIGDGPIIEQFTAHFPRARQFDPQRHSIDILSHKSDVIARAIAQTPFPDKPLMTYDHGKMALTELLLTTTSLTNLPKIDHKGEDEAKLRVRDMFHSPIIKRMLTEAPNFSLNLRRRKSESSIIANLDRAKLGEQNAFIVATLLATLYQGQVVVSDFGFYARDFYLSLMRENRLTVTLRSLSQVPEKLQDELLLFNDIYPNGVLYRDALRLAEQEGLAPGVVGHTERVTQLLTTHS